MWEHNEIESQVLDFSKGFTLLKDIWYNPQSVQTLFNSQFILVEDKPKILMVICITKEHITSFAVEWQQLFEVLSHGSVESDFIQR